MEIAFSVRILKQINVFFRTLQLFFWMIWKLNFVRSAGVKSKYHSRHL